MDIALEDTASQSDPNPLVPFWDPADAQHAEHKCVAADSEAVHCKVSVLACRRQGLSLSGLSSALQPIGFVPVAAGSEVSTARQPCSSCTLQCLSEVMAEQPFGNHTDLMLLPELLGSKL